MFSNLKSPFFCMLLAFLNISLATMFSKWSSCQQAWPNDGHTRLTPIPWLTFKNQGYNLPLSSKSLDLGQSLACIWQEIPRRLTFDRHKWKFVLLAISLSTSVWHPVLEGIPDECWLPSTKIFCHLQLFNFTDFARLGITI